MFKYEVEVPSPSAERLNFFKTFYINYNSSWSGAGTMFKTTIRTDLKFFEFILPKEYIYLDPNIIDSDYHESYIIFENISKTRSEKYQLHPSWFYYDRRKTKRNFTFNFNLAG